MKWEKEEFETSVKLLKDGLNYYEIGLKINRSEDSVRGKLQKNGFSYRDEQKETIICLECSKGIEVSKSGNRKFCDKSCSAKYNNKLRIKKDCGNCKNCNKKLNKKRKKYCNNKCQGEYKRDEIFRLIENGDETLHVKNYRNFLIEKHGDNCMKCSWNEVNPITRLVPIQLDHIDGDSDNNNLKNLRLLCPNCHSLTPTFGRLNENSSRSKRKDYRKKHRNNTQ